MKSLEENMEDILDIDVSKEPEKRSNYQMMSQKIGKKTMSIREQNFIDL